MILSELISKIGFQVDDSKLKDVNAQLGGIKTLLESFAAAEVIKGIVEMAEKFGEFAQQITQAATSAGLTTEAFQKLAFSAQQSGVSQNELSMAMTRVTRQLYAAKMGGGEAMKVFGQMGFTANQIMGFKNAGDVMLATADKVRALGNANDKTAVTTLLMGRNAGKMVGWFNEGSAAIRDQMDTAERYGAVLKASQVDVLVKAEHSMAAFGSVLKVISASIASEFAPSISEATKQFLDFYAVNKDIFQLEIKRWAYDISFAFGFIWGITKTLVQTFLDFAKTHEVLTRRVGEFILMAGAFVSVLFGIGTALKFANLALQPFNVLMAVTETELFAVLSPFLAVGAAIGLLVVAVHDLWEVAHGRPGWMNQLIEFLGIGKEVQAVFFTMFDAVSAVFELFKDLGTLKFGKFFRDAVGDITTLAAPLKWIADTSDRIAKNVANFILPGSVSGNNLVGAAAAASVPLQTLGGTSSSQTTVNGSQAYTLNAPININVPPGTNPQETQQTVRESLLEHLDRMHREAQRSLTPVQVQ